MLQDVLAHRPTEIDALNGGIVRAGRSAGVATPLHAAIAALIAGVEAGWEAVIRPLATSRSRRSATASCASPRGAAQQGRRSGRPGSSTPTG